MFKNSRGCAGLPHAWSSPLKLLKSNRLSYATPFLYSRGCAGLPHCHSAPLGLLRIARACSISSIEMNSSTETFCVTDMLFACDLEFSKILDLDRSSRSCRVCCRSSRPCALFGRPCRPTRTCLPHLRMFVPCLGIYFTFWVKYIKIPASSKNHENQAHARVTRKMESDQGSEQGLGEGREGQRRDSTPRLPLLARTLRRTTLCLKR